MNVANRNPVKNWKVSQLPDLTGKTYFITGANSGIGYESAVHLRRANANVIVGARSESKGKAAIQSLRSVASAGSADLLLIDLADSSSIRRADKSLRELTDGLDAIVNNAGVMQTPQQQTADGFEMQFGTNHLGHFLLNSLVFDLVESRSGRIVPVSSIAHRGGKMFFDDLMLTHNYSPTAAYSQSKLANIVYGFELARRLESVGSNVISVPTHPGYAATNLQSTGPTGLFKQFYKLTNAVLAQSAADGAVPLVLGAAGAEAQNGVYYGPTMFVDSRGPVGESTVAKAAKDETTGTKLWSLSEELLGITFSVG